MWSINPRKHQFFNLRRIFLFIQILLIPLIHAALSTDGKGLPSNAAAKNLGKQFEVVEGSGNPTKFDQFSKKPSNSPSSLITQQLDDKKWEVQGSGASPDDEDGDDGDEIEGSGVEGSGRPQSIQNARTTQPKTTIKVDTTTSTISNTMNINVPLEEKTSPALSNKAPLFTTASTNTLTMPTSTPQTTTTTKAKSLQPYLTTTMKTPITVNTRPTPGLPPLQPPYITETAFEMLKPGILAAICGGAVVGLLVTILLVMFIVYRMRKKDEGSYSLDEPNHPPNYSYAYQKASTKEFYA